MLSKNEIKYIQSLCHKKQRQKDGLFIAEGSKLVDELINSDYTVKKIYGTESWVSNHTTAIETITVSDMELEKISGLQSPNQVLAIAEQKKQMVSPVLTQNLTIVLDGIQDPGNLGTIIRIADWFGIKQIIAGMDTVELYNPKVIQSSMGSFLRVNLWYQSLAELLENPGVSVYGALLHGSNIHNETSIAEGILVIGNESKGISEGLLPFINHPVTIPRIGGAESLNAAVATGIILSHLKKG